MRFIFQQGVMRGPTGRATVSLPGGFEPDSIVMVVVPVPGRRSEPPTPSEFRESMLGERDNFEKGIIDEDRVDAMRVLNVNTNTVPNTGRVDLEPIQSRMDALVVEIRTSLQPAEAQRVDDRMRRELASTFYIDTFSRVIK